jgi:hypothetical protein
VRVLLVDHAYRLLLDHVHDPDDPARGTWWELPPLAEVIGDGVRVGPCVWRGGDVEYRVAWLDDPAAPHAQPVGLPARLGERWWTLDEIAASAETFDPPVLPALAPAVVRGDY